MKTKALKKLKEFQLTVNEKNKVRGGMNKTELVKAIAEKP
jgi:hypothetical protein